MAVMTWSMGGGADTRLMRRALMLSIVLHAAISGWWLQRLSQQPPELPSRFEVVLQAASPAIRPRSVSEPVAPAAPPSRVQPKPRHKPVTRPPQQAKPKPKRQPKTTVPRKSPAAAEPVPVPTRATLPAPAARPAAPVSPPAPAATAAPQPVPPRPAARFDNPKPWYPRMARRRGMEGRVELWVTVGTDGTVRAITVGRSSGYRLLDEAALETVRQWRFEPARLAGLPVEARLMVPIRFRLQDAAVRME